MSRKFECIKVDNLIKFSAQGMDLALFVGNETKVKISFEIKSPLDRYLYKMEENWASKTFKNLCHFISSQDIIMYKISSF